MWCGGGSAGRRSRSWRWSRRRCARAHQWRASPTAMAKVGACCSRGGGRLARGRFRAWCRFASSRIRRRGRRLPRLQVLNGLRGLVRRSNLYCGTAVCCVSPRRSRRVCRGGERRRWTADAFAACRDARAPRARLDGHAQGLPRVGSAGADGAEGGSVLRPPLPVPWQARRPAEGVVLGRQGLVLLAKRLEEGRLWSVNNVTLAWDELW